MADFTDDDDALLAELGVEITPKRTGTRTPQQERVIAGFEDIQRFVEEHGHAPRHGEGYDIFERLYAVRLDRICQLPECRELVEPLDHQALLGGRASAAKDDADDLDDDALLAELGVDEDLSGITELRHVRSSAEKRAAEEVANRERCEDFDAFKPLFEQVQRELDQGVRSARPFELKAEIKPGRFFIVGGRRLMWPRWAKSKSRRKGERMRGSA